MRCDRPRDVGGIGQECAQKTDGADLDGEPQAVVLAAADVHKLACGGVEVEVAVQLRLVGIVDVAAVSALMLGGEKALARPLSGRPLRVHHGQPARSAPELARRY